MTTEPTTTTTTAKPIQLSNSMRLTGRQWFCVALCALLFAQFAPSLWELYEAFPLEDDYRVPQQLKQDYWLYERFARLAATKYDGFVVGDSVVWGVYAKRPETLSHYLNQQAGGERFANFGMIGCHPLALEGLISHYAGAISGKNVVLQCNLLWLTSPKEDYQEKIADEAPEALFHTGLIPQFWPNVPRYQQEVSRRLNVLFEQRSPISQWANHLQQAYFNQESIPSWSMTHPYADPLVPLTKGLPPSDNTLEKLQQPWFKNSSKKPKLLNPPWIDMETSLQWAAFQRAVRLLLSRDNRVFVVVGPFNEHMLSEASKARCQEVKAVIETWLRANEVPHVIAEVLPSAEYGDLSHPLPAGYERMAKTLWQNAAFRTTMKGLE